MDNLTPTLHLKAVDSRIANEDELREAHIKPDQYPSNLRWSIMAHQAATVRSLRFGSAPIIINQAMTGDGKSFAGQFMFFNDPGWSTFTMYPTNELAADQERSLDDLLSRWTPRRGTPDIQRINAAEIDRIQTLLTNKRVTALNELIGSDLILTNPDIFHLAIQFAYQDYGGAPDFILGRIARRYRLFIFDEFHLFGAAQSASVMIALLLIKTITTKERVPRFLFLSATPQRTLEALAAKAEIEVEIIDGAYQSSDNAGTADDGWRRILQPVDLSLYEGRLEDWIREHLNDVILAFFSAHRPGARGVIIANSVATAHRIYDFLYLICQQAGIRLAINTGLIPPNRREREFDLLVATSTIDVGVDFHINLLIFESPDANTHLQRLGRLGRHLTDQHANRFEHFEAHALLPDWVIKNILSRINPDEAVSRVDYDEAIREAMTDPQEFALYPRKWAGLQAGHVLSQLRDPVIRDEYKDFLPNLRDRYFTLFGGSLNRYRATRDEQKVIFAAAQSFRGSSPFTALVLDVSPLRENSEVQTYNLISLLLRGELEAVNHDDLLRQAERHGLNVQSLNRAKPLAAYKLLGWREKPREISIRYEQELLREQQECVIECQNVLLHIPDNQGLGMKSINDQLETRTLAAFFIPNQDPYNVRRMLRLGIQIELFPFQSIDNAQGCAAFGQHALLLDSAWKRLKSRASNEPFIS